MHNFGFLFVFSNTIVIVINSGLFKCIALLKRFVLIPSKVNIVVIKLLRKAAHSYQVELNKLVVIYLNKTP